MTARSRCDGPHGFALPVALFALVLLATLIVGVLFVATEELRAGRSDIADQRALAIAEWAVEQAVSEWRPEHNTGMATGKTVLLNAAAVSEGETVEVSLTRTQLRSFWLVASAAVRDGRFAPARRAVGVSLRLDEPPVPLQAALSAEGIVTVRDGGTVSGEDLAPSAVHGRRCAELPRGDAAGVLAPDSTSVCGETCTGEAPTGVSGSPPVAASASVSSDSTVARPTQVLYTLLAGRATAVLAGGTIIARPVESNGVCDATIVTNWGDPDGTTSCAHHFPVVVSRGSVVLAAGSVGQGVLLVDGDLELEPGARFAGVVVVTDDITLRGPNSELVGVAVAGDGDRAGGSRVVDGGAIRFASCAARVAALGAAQVGRTPERWWSELR